jgi:ABC-type Fe3+-hydroxamate transport system substrate-binding protein
VVAGVSSLSLVLLTACSSGSNGAAPSSTTHAASAPTSSPTSTMVTTSTVPGPTPTTVAASPSGEVDTVPATASIRSELTAAFVADRSDAANTPGYAALPPGAVQGISPGSLYVAMIPATGAYWAPASFSPSPGISDQAFIGFQDGGNTAVFSRSSAAPWTVTYVGPCTSARVPAAVLATWGVTKSDYPGC